MSASILGEFARLYAKTVAKAVALMIGVPALAYLATVVVAWPMFLGVYLELGLLPFEGMFFGSMPQGEISRRWLYALPVWWVLGLTAIYAAIETVESHDSSTDEREGGQ